MSKGATIIPDDITDMMYQLTLSSAEFRLLNLAIRKRFGFRDNALPLSAGYIATKLNITRRTAINISNELVRLKILTKYKIVGSDINHYDINPNIKEWVIGEKYVRSEKLCTSEKNFTSNSDVLPSEKDFTTSSEKNFTPPSEKLFTHNQTLVIIKHKKNQTKKKTKKEKSQQITSQVPSVVDPPNQVSKINKIKLKKKTKNAKDKNKITTSYKLTPEERQEMREKYPILLDQELRETFLEFVKMRDEIKKPLTRRALMIALKHLAKYSEGNAPVAVMILEKSIAEGWQGLFPLDDKELKVMNGSKRVKVFKQLEDEYVEEKRKKQEAELRKYDEEKYGVQFDTSGNPINHRDNNSLQHVPFVTKPNLLKRLAY
jgi:hypothetical protein